MPDNRPQYKCRRCGLGANSKCPSQRTVFPAGDVSSMISASMSHAFTSRVEDEEVERAEWAGGGTMTSRTITLEFNRMLTLESEHEEFTPNYMIDKLADILSDPDLKQALKQAICYHRWEIQHGECLFGCHKAEEE